MTNLARKNQKVFASGASNNGQFGSLQAETKVLSNDVETLQALAAYESGWNSAVVSGEQLPSLEEFQALNYINTYQIGYILQKGFPEWNTNTTYYIGDLAREVGGTKIYKSITDSNSGNALTDTANWEFVTNFNLATTTTSGSSILPNRITIANNATDPDHDIDFSGGVFNFDDGSGQAVATALTKQIDVAWAAGDNQGGLDTGTVANSSTYYMFAIWNPTTSTADYLFSTSVDSPILPSGYTKQKRIAALETDGSANIRVGKYYFNPDGSYRFQYDSNVTDVSVNTITTGSRTLYPLTVPPSFIAVFTFQGFTETGAPGTKTIYVTDPNLSDTTTPTFRWIQGGNENESVVAYLECGTDSSSRIGIRGNDSDPDIDIYTRGWIDYNL